MPLYEYFCLDCRQSFDLLRKADQADAPARCEECDSLNTVRRLSLIAAPIRNAGDGASLSAGGGCACGHGGCACH